MHPGCGLSSFVRLWLSRLPLLSVGCSKRPFLCPSWVCSSEVDVRSRCQIGSLETDTERPLILELLRFTLGLVHDPPPPEQNWALSSALSGKEGSTPGEARWLPDLKSPVAILVFWPVACSSDSATREAGAWDAGPLRLLQTTLSSNPGGRRCTRLPFHRRKRASSP